MKGVSYVQGIISVKTNVYPKCSVSKGTCIPSPEFHPKMLVRIFLHYIVVTRSNTCIPFCFYEKYKQVILRNKLFISLPLNAYFSINICRKKMRKYSDKLECIFWPLFIVQEMCNWINSKGIQKKYLRNVKSKYTFLTKL